MFDARTGHLSNAFVGDANRPLMRLTIAVMSASGKAATIEFKRDDQSTDLVAHLPTDEELNADYLVKNDWTQTYVKGLGELWNDPIGGGDYTFQNALDLQTARDYRDLKDGTLAFEDTPLALEMLGGE